MTATGSGLSELARLAREADAEPLAREADALVERVREGRFYVAFVIGLVQQLGGETLLIPDNVRIFLTAGMMGGLTTYSTFSYETIRLMETNAWHQAWINIFVTTTIARSVCFLGIAVGRLVLSLRG